MIKCIKCNAHKSKLMYDYTVRTKGHKIVMSFNCAECGTSQEIPVEKKIKK